MYKIIFLDVDGVICLYPEWQKSWIGNRNDELDRQCCIRLKEILDKTNAKIVLSSSWRLDQQHIDDLIYKLTPYNITKDYFIGYTPILYCSLSKLSPGNQRWREIEKYILDNNIIKYIILDDFNITKTPKDNFVRTKMHTGITELLKDVCINKLMKG